jgi:hypothetical protein
VIPDFAQPYSSFLQDSQEMQALLRQHASSQASRDLFWRGIQLSEAVQPPTVMKILAKVAARELDRSPSGYGILGLATDAQMPTPDPTKSQPTVWDYRGLKSKPWHDDESSVSATLTRNFSTIRDEYEQASKFLRDHPDSALAKTGNWLSVFLYGVKGKNTGVEALCPKTFEIIDKLPFCRNFGFAMFSVLSPGTHLLAHTGSTNLRLRHHLALEVPTDRPAQIRVGTETREWKKGEVLVFDDSFEHEVTNQGSTPRVALIIDTWHPKLTEPDISFLSETIFSRFGKIDTSLPQDD